MIPDIHKALKGHPLVVKVVGVVIAFCSMIICVIICIIFFNKNVYIVVTISCNVCIFGGYYTIFLASRMHAV